MTKEEQLKKLGERVREIRINKKITQKDLAHKTNKDQQSVQRLESGKINPSFYYLCEIAEGLEVGLEDILKDL